MTTSSPGKGLSSWTHKRVISAKVCDFCQSENALVLKSTVQTKWKQQQKTAKNAKQTDLYLHTAFNSRHWQSNKCFISFHSLLSSSLTLNPSIWLFVASRISHSFEKGQNPPTLNYSNISKFKGEEILPSRNCSCSCKHVYIVIISLPKNFGLSKVLLLSQSSLKYQVLYQVTNLVC